MEHKRSDNGVGAKPAAVHAAVSFLEQPGIMANDDAQQGTGASLGVLPVVAGGRYELLIKLDATSATEGGDEYVDKLHAAVGSPEPDYEFAGLGGRLYIKHQRFQAALSPWIHGYTRAFQVSACTVEGAMDGWNKAAGAFSEHVRRYIQVAGMVAASVAITGLTAGQATLATRFSLFMLLFGGLSFATLSVVSASGLGGKCDDHVTRSVTVVNAAMLVMHDEQGAAGRGMAARINKLLHKVASAAEVFSVHPRIAVGKALLFAQKVRI